MTHEPFFDTDSTIRALRARLSIGHAPRSPSRPSVREFVMIDSSRRPAQIWRRNVDGDFVRYPAFATLDLDTLGCSISLDDFHDDLVLQTP